MTWENAYVLGLALAVILLLAFEKVHLSVLGIGLMLALTVPGILEIDSAISGFGHPALVTIASLFVVGEAFLRTGAASILAQQILQRTGKSEAAVVMLVMVMAATLSAFVNNTLVVVTFLPVITTICRDGGFLPSRLLIPLSYASILGGLCTLVGTSTNLLVNGAMVEMQMPHMTMFTMTGAAVILASVGILYLALFGRRLLPHIPSLSAQMGNPLREYVMEITIGKNSILLGTPASEVRDAKGLDAAKTMMVVRGETLHWPPFDDLLFQEDDVLMLSGSIQELSELQKTETMATAEEADSYDPAEMGFFELALAPNSSWVGRRVGEVALKSDFGAVVVAVQRSGRHIRERASSMTLQGGDVLLAFGDERSKAFLRTSRDFHVIEGVQEAIHRTEKAPWAFGVILAVIALFVTDAVHYSTAALFGAFAVTVSGCLNVRQTHEAIKWPLIIFIAGMMALSQGLQASGTTELIAGGFRDMLPAGHAAYILLILMFGGTVVLTEFLTNNAVALLMTPVAIETARTLGLEPMPFAMAVALGASSSFANPMGYQTNLMVMGPGGYRFRHFIKVGLPLDLLMTATGVLVIPWFWPLT